MSLGRNAGCYFWQPSQMHGNWMKLPMVECKAHTVIKGSATRTSLKQYYNNVSSRDLEKCQYAFPLYDGVSIVGFKCEIGDKVLQGIVKEREEAKQEFDKAVAAGESAGLMEQSLSASDVFTTSLGNVPKGSTAIVTVEYIAELKHDLETDSLKFEMPTGIAPRYGGSDVPYDARLYPCAVDRLPASRGFEWTCDIQSPTAITKVDSPTHSVSITLGQLSTEAETDEPDFKKCSAKMTLQKESGLSKELILTVKSKGIKDPVALWETHPEVPNHSALMTTLVPNFALPQIKPEVVFVCDRSGSMSGGPMTTLVDALRVMLHSLPANGIKFNICSFGSNYSFLFNKSQSYSKATLKQATDHLDTFSANYGGTETAQAIRAAIEQRYGDIPLEIILLTDGDIWHQESLFTYLNEKVAESKKQIRVFPLGIGHGVSSALIEGVARAGNGFASTVMPGERMDQRCMRMLKAALSPHIIDYKLEVVYEKEEDDEFEMIERVEETIGLAVRGKTTQDKESKKQPISLFDSNANADDVKMADASANQPKLSAPKVLQAPFNMPPLYSFSRSTVYLLLGPESAHRVPKTVILKGSLDDNELKLEIPVINTGSFRTIHQLAARRAVQDLEEGRGWPFAAKTEDGKTIREAHPSSFDDIVKAEAVRLGTTFQVMNRWCSYVAREPTAHKRKAKGDKMNIDQHPVYGAAVPASSVDMEEKESSDDDMGFALIDDETPSPAPPSQTNHPYPVASSSRTRDRERQPMRRTGLASMAARPMAAPVSDIQVSYTPSSVPLSPSPSTGDPAGYSNPQPRSGAGSGRFGVHPGTVTSPSQQASENVGVFSSIRPIPHARKSLSASGKVSMLAESRVADLRIQGCVPVSVGRSSVCDTSVQQAQQVQQVEPHTLLQALDDVIQDVEGQQAQLQTVLTQLQTQHVQMRARQAQQHVHQSGQRSFGGPAVFGARPMQPASVHQSVPAQAPRNRARRVQQSSTLALVPSGRPVTQASSSASTPPPFEALSATSYASPASVQHITHDLGFPSGKLGMEGAAGPSKSDALAQHTKVLQPGIGKSGMEWDFGTMEACDVLDQFNFDAFLDGGAPNAWNFDMEGFQGSDKLTESAVELGNPTPAPTEKPKFTEKRKRMKRRAMSLDSNSEAGKNGPARAPRSLTKSDKHSQQPEVAGSANFAHVSDLDGVTNLNASQTTDDESQSADDDSDFASHTSRGRARYLKEDDEDKDEDAETGATPAPPVPSFPDDASRVRFLISLQEFDGSFETKGKGAARLATVLKIAEEKINSAPVAEVTDETVWATVLVLVFLEENMGEEKEVWEMSAEKARTWLDDLASEKGLDLKPLMAQAATVLKLRARKA